MILIIGGRCQGKLTFAAGFPAYGEKTDGQSRFDDGMVADGRIDSFDKVYETSVIYHLEAYIRRLMEEKQDTDGFIEGIIHKNNHVLVIADEIGCGIVPVDAFEREYRELEGRLCQRIAAASEQVYRVVCGIGTRIK